MKKLVLFLLLSLFPAAFASAQGVTRYVTAISPTPVLNTPNFHQMFGGSIALDPCKGVRPIEFIALPGTLFSIEGEERDNGVTIYRVTTGDYPYPSKTGYFVDARFVAPVAGAPKERPRRLPELAVVQQRLLAAVDKPYVWGGNVKDGIPLLRKLYPDADPLAGVDCSGLLYEATDGFTPRNTSALTSFGSPVAVAGLSAEKIAQKLEPLDLIVWKGHVMMVLDEKSIIQSTMGCEGVSGVHITEKEETLRRLMKSRKPADSYPQGGAGAKSFVVRRWFRR